MRLTRKEKSFDFNDNYEIYYFDEYVFPDHSKVCDAIDKLGQLEDIEDEYGIDLITLFKLMNAENVYSYGNANIMKNTGQVDMYNKTIVIWNGSCHQVYPLSEYGKAFALTKEELL